MMSIKAWWLNFTSAFGIQRRLNDNELLHGAIAAISNLMRDSNMTPTVVMGEVRANGIYAYHGAQLQMTMGTSRVSEGSITLMVCDGCCYWSTSTQKLETAVWQRRHGLRASQVRDTIVEFAEVVPADAE